MMRRNLLAWQWSDYSPKHRSRAKLLLHIVAVPLFQVATVVLILSRSGTTLGLAAAGMVVALVIQGCGHRFERQTPAPFEGASDFVSRFVVEQWITFPRFVLSGGWYRNLRRAH